MVCRASLSVRFAEDALLQRRLMALYVWLYWCVCSPLGHRWKPSPMLGSLVFPYAMFVGAPVQSLMVSWWGVISLSFFVPFVISQLIICHFVLWYASDPPVRLLTSFHPCALVCIRVTASDVGSWEVMSAETWPSASSTYAILWCLIARSWGEAFVGFDCYAA